jgi:hypothetical protein
VCAHSPISADDCKPNKSLRLTVKAFIKSEEKKREKEKAVSAAAILPPTPSAAESPATPVADSVEVNEDGLKPSQSDDQPHSAADASYAAGISRIEIEPTGEKEVSGDSCHIIYIPNSSADNKA